MINLPTPMSDLRPLPVYRTATQSKFSLEPPNAGIYADGRHICFVPDFGNFTEVCETAEITLLAPQTGDQDDKCPCEGGQTEYHAVSSTWGGGK